VNDTYTPITKPIADFEVKFVTCFLFVNKTDGS